MDTVMAKLTPVREEILSIIEDAGIPVNVSVIMDTLTSTPNISTVYRALDYFERNQYVHSISLSGMRYYYGSSRGGHGHFLFCRECRELITFDDCIVHTLQKKLQKQYEYQISSHVLFFEGLCGECGKLQHKKSQSIFSGERGKR